MFFNSTLPHQKVSKKGQIFHVLPVYFQNAPANTNQGVNNGASSSHGTAGQEGPVRGGLKRKLDAAEDQNDLVAALLDKVHKLEAEQDRSRLQAIDDQVQSLLVLVSGKPAPTNSHVLSLLSNVASEARRKGHAKAELLQELYCGAIRSQEDISLAALVKTTLGGAEHDRVQAAINKVAKAEEVRAKLETAKLQKKNIVHAKSPVERAAPRGDGESSSYTPPPKKSRKDEVICHLCEKKGHFIRECPDLAEVRKSLGKK